MFFQRVQDRHRVEPLAVGTLNLKSSIFTILGLALIFCMFTPRFGLAHILKASYLWTNFVACYKVVHVVQLNQNLLNWWSERKELKVQQFQTVAGERCSFAPLVEVRRNHQLLELPSSTLPYTALWASTLLLPQYTISLLSSTAHLILHTTSVVLNTSSCTLPLP